ncbi:YcaO-like family protein [Cytobacillus kochii]|uniref:YcaO domain-containing protein n=1 Tax=Cytobacillus kochii TaxID=859143 RepID=A0A248TPT2_9BACI|nr:YcaO-like family protein [Cytobacillus kochii]ASV70206.1 hypothetical protein CKF48_23260 [Cytobacillus kochii]
MILERQKGIRYGVRYSKFTNKNLYMAISNIGTFIDQEGYIGPTSCGAVSSNKKEAVLKAHSESVERRSLMIGGKAKGSYVDSFDIIKQRISKVKKEYTSYQISYPMIVDTTGTATHFDANQAIYNSIKELFEKNAIFLFWYGLNGSKINVNLTSAYQDHILNTDESYCLFLQDFFSPLKVVVCIVKCKDGSPLKYKFGVGSSLNLEEACEKAMSEAYFLGKYHENILFNAILRKSKIKESISIEALNHMDKIFNLPYNESSCSKKHSLGVQEGIHKIITNLPKWVKELHIVCLHQNLNNELMVVKAISPQLYSHIPKKEYINIKNVINKHTLNLSEEQLLKIPDCLII